MLAAVGLIIVSRVSLILGLTEIGPLIRLLNSLNEKTIVRPDSIVTETFLATVITSNTPRAYQVAPTHSTRSTRVSAQWVNAVSIMDRATSQKRCP
jgi:hypothetical protein